MEIEPKNMKNLVISAFVLSILAIIFSIGCMWVCYDGTTIIEHKEFDGLHPGLRKLYKRIVLGSDGVKPYIERINDKYEKAIDAAGGEHKFNDAMVDSVKKYMDNHPFIKIN